MSKHPFNVQMSEHTINVQMSEYPVFVDATLQNGEYCSTLS